MIQIKGLKFKNILDVKDVTLQKGFNFIKGPNGAGKSTLLDCVCKLNPDYKGEILGNENMVYLNQNLYFSDRLSSKEFVKFVFKLDGIPSWEDAFFKTTRKYGLEESFKKIWKKEIGRLSGGERKRLFFFTIISLDRDWYVFDEPFTGVDEDGKNFMISIFEEILAKDKNIIITTHEIEPLYSLDKRFPVHTLEMKEGTLSSLDKKKTSSKSTPKITDIESYS